MVRVGAGVRIIMGQGICKGVGKVSGALGATVDMKAENRILTRTDACWKTEKFGSNQGSVSTLVKADLPLNTWIGIASADDGNGPRREI